MAVWVHVIRFSFFVFKLKNESPFGYTHSNVFDLLEQKRAILLRACLQLSGTLWAFLVENAYAIVDVKQVLALEVALMTSLDWFLVTSIFSIYRKNYI